MKTFKNDFNEIYIEYHHRMLRFAIEYVIIKEDAENIVQDIFLHLWERRNALKIETSLSSYLFTLLKNKCIDHLRHINIVAKFKAEYKAKLSALELLNEQTPIDTDLEELIFAAIKKLPERCRLIFIKSRFDEKKYHEIAAELNISLNTVENQISIALKKLRKELKDYLPLLLLLAKC